MNGINIPNNAKGERVAQYELPFTEVTGEYFVGYSINYISDSGKMLPVVFYSSNKLYCNIYGASSSAVTNGSINVRAIFMTNCSKTDVDVNMNPS